jgi:hypothetical protein
MSPIKSDDANFRPNLAPSLPKLDEIYILERTFFLTLKLRFFPKLKVFPMIYRKWFGLKVLMLQVLVLSIAWEAQAQIADHVELSESQLMEIGSGEFSPQHSLILATQKQTEFIEQKNADMFNPKIIAEGSYAKTNEQPQFPFAPVFSPVTTYSLGLQKKFQRGLTTELKSSLRKTLNAKEAPPLRDQAITVTEFNLSVDLWKNLFGRIDRSESQKLSIEKQKGQLTSKVSQKVFTVELRKIYWQLMANQEALMISQELAKTSEKQFRLAQEKLKRSIGDKGVVARYQAQAANRQANVTGLSFARQQLISLLNEKLPVLKKTNWKMPVLNLDTTVKKVMTCVDKIEKFANPPLEFTFYDELVALTNEQFEWQKKIDHEYDKIHVTFAGQLKTTGLDVNTSESLNDGFQENRTGASAGLQVVIPLDGHWRGTSSAKEHKQFYEKHLFYYQKHSWQAAMDARHEHLIRSIQFLKESLAAQKISKDALTTSLTSTQKKYEQARISESDLINDQDQLLVSELELIEIKYQVIETLLSYFTLFQEFPCEFNYLDQRGENT